jgi:hypothetical protein
MIGAARENRASERLLSALSQKLLCLTHGVQSSAVQHCHRNSEVAAHDLLMPYGDVVMALSIVLRIKRTLDGVEIDTIISDVEARKALERQRRADCASASWPRAVFARNVITSMARLPHPALVRYR